MTLAKTLSLGKTTSASGQRIPLELVKDFRTVRPGVLVRIRLR